MKISYAICVKDELEEISRLLNFLHQNKKTTDEICVLLDKPKASLELIDQLYYWSSKDIIKLKESTFNNNFSDWKNELNRMCSGDWIFNIDADEIPNEFLINNIHLLLEMNPDIDAYWVPRINTLEGDKDEILKYVKSQRWNIDENGYINKWDPQMRIYKNDSSIKWEGNPHEKIIGYKKFSTLPFEEEYCLYHPKTLTRQIKQNNFYSSL
jgi:hypothetical protein